MMLIFLSEFERCCLVGSVSSSAACVNGTVYVVARLLELFYNMIHGTHKSVRQVLQTRR